MQTPTLVSSKYAPLRSIRVCILPCNLFYFFFWLCNCFFNIAQFQLALNICGTKKRPSFSDDNYGYLIKSIAEEVESNVSLYGPRTIIMQSRET